MVIQDKKVACTKLLAVTRFLFLVLPAHPEFWGQRGNSVQVYGGFLDRAGCCTWVSLASSTTFPLYILVKKGGGGSIPELVENEKCPLVFVRALNLFLVQVMPNAPDVVRRIFIQSKGMVEPFLDCLLLLYQVRGHKTLATMLFC